MIRVKDLVHRYADKEVLNGISFEVKRGEILGLLGLNGIGKTTTIKIITGLTVQNGGEATINGYSVRKDPDKTKFLFRTLSQENTLDKDLSVYENLYIWAMLYQIKKDIIGEVLAATGLKDLINSPISKLSGGEQRRLMLARTMMGDPQVLFLDEPSLGLDARIRKFMWESILEAKKRDSAILLTTHYIEEAEHLCDRVGILYKGKIVAIDSPKNLIQNLGEYACVWFDDESKERVCYFKSLQEARYMSRQDSHNKAVRKTNLEDVFLSLTSKES